ncbi:Rv3235 family protein [Mycolicibacterium grossiae]|uniref:Rv3235 family protein n=1 Tax=Mycolicibacterium grossiae TaxID=1552759 RepID=UPI001B85FB48|nr:Rv3235 family protein [Mycolicibacterium grossiae]
MTAAPVTPPLASPVVDYEPPPVSPGDPACPMPRPDALHRHSPRPLNPATRPAREKPAREHPAPPAREHPAPPAREHPAPPAREHPAPPAAVAFADVTLRHVLEVIDRRRPLTQLRHALRPALLDAVAAHARQPSAAGAAVLRRVRLRTVAAGTAEPAAAGTAEPAAAEVFATYTRGRRVRAVAGRVEVVDGRWQLVALQLG